MEIYKVHVELSENLANYFFLGVGYTFSVGKYRQMIWVFLLILQKATLLFEKFINHFITFIHKVRTIIPLT